jgi:HSP20 family protein
MKNLSPASSGNTPALFDDFFKPWNEWFSGSGSPATFHVPAVNVSETEKNYDVTLAAPGMKKEDFRIDVDGNLLTVSSEQEHKEEESGKKFTRREYSYSSFSRSFNLPEEVNLEKIEASYKDGILHIVLPRVSSGKKTSAKTIAVK